MPTILKATNCNRTYIAKDVSLTADFHSNIADFYDMPMGSVQVVWKNVTGTKDGQVVLHCSNLPESDSYFDGGEIDGATITVNSTNGNQMWLREKIAFRYLQARFTKNNISGGTIDIVALGKKT